MTAPIPPLELRSPMPHQAEISHALRKAMKAALGGDFAALDKLEIEFLNVLVRIGELSVKHPDGTPHWWFDKHCTRNQAVDWELWAPFVTARHRGFGPRGEAALEWTVREKCRRCAWLLRHVDCRICESRWWIEFDELRWGRWGHAELQAATLYTDLDGVLLEAAT